MDVAAIGPNAWGKGKTEAEAKGNLRKHTCMTTNNDKTKERTVTNDEHLTKPKFCHVCGYEVRVIHGRIARHFGRSYTGRRQLCLGSDELHRPRLESMDFRGLRRLT